MEKHRLRFLKTQITIFAHSSEKFWPQNRRLTGKFESLVENRSINL